MNLMSVMEGDGLREILRELSDRYHHDCLEEIMQH